MKHDETYKQNTVVRMEKLSSAEHIVKDSGAPERVLKSIWMRIERGQVWGIYAPALYESCLLLEIMANVRPYEDGRCVLMERGMMRRKRVILPHVFYIGSTDMLYSSMNVLEYLMFATSKKKTKSIERQEILFEWLVDIGLGGISLTKIRWLDNEEKALVILIASICSDSTIIVLNLPFLHFDSALITAFRKISYRIKNDKKALILNTKNAELIQQVCTHTAVLAKGRLLYQGTVDYLRNAFDSFDVTIHADNELESKLKKTFPLFVFKRKNDDLYIRGSKDQTSSDIYKAIIQAGFVPEKMKVNPKTVKNALEELTQRRDLS